MSGDLRVYQIISNYVFRLILTLIFWVSTDKVPLVRKKVVDPRVKFKNLEPCSSSIKNKTVVEN